MRGSQRFVHVVVAELQSAMYSMIQRYMQQVCSSNAVSRFKFYRGNKQFFPSMWHLTVLKAKGCSLPLCRKQSQLWLNSVCSESVIVWSRLYVGQPLGLAVAADVILSDSLNTTCKIFPSKVYTKDVPCSFPVTHKSPIWRRGYSASVSITPRGFCVPQVVFLSPPLDIRWNKG